MKTENRDLMKEGLVRYNNFIHRSREKIGYVGIKKMALDAYLALPPKLQYALAKYGVRTALQKKKEEIEELIRH